MLYPTHIRTGYLFGFTNAALFSSVYLYNAHNGITGLFMSMILTVSGAAFGSGFPDIDSPGSTPARRHPIIKNIFKLCGVHHRGKFSHSVASETLFWAAVFGLVYALLHLVHGIGGEQYALVLLGFRILFGGALGSQIRTLNSALYALMNSQVGSINGIINFLLFIMTDDSKYSSIINYKDPRKEKNKNQFSLFILTIASYALGFILVFFIMPIDGSSKVSLINNATYYSFVYIVGIWAGAMSHMLMDISTYEGIYILWGNTRVAPAQAMSRIPILKWFVPNNQFKTGTGWESFVRVIVSLAEIAMFAVMIYKFVQLIKTGQF